MVSAVSRLTDNVLPPSRSPCGVCTSSFEFNIANVTFVTVPILRYSQSTGQRLHRSLPRVASPWRAASVTLQRSGSPHIAIEDGSVFLVSFWPSTTQLGVKDASLAIVLNHQGWRGFYAPAFRNSVGEVKKVLFKLIHPLPFAAGPASVNTLNAKGSLVSRLFKSDISRERNLAGGVGNNRMLQMMVLNPHHEFSRSDAGT